MIKSIKAFFDKRKKRKTRIKAKTESVLADYNKLLNEYKELQEHPTRFSKKNKLRISSRVHFLISKGHIVVNSKV
jgi:hypothetical protein